MKQLLFTLFLFIGACTEDVKEKTVLTSIAYVNNISNNDHRFTIARKTTKGDKVTYQVPVLDTARINGNPVYDSARKVQFTLNWIPINDTLILQDYNKDWK
jgi:hypothetical protein